MDVGTAFGVLGVEPNAPLVDARRAYRARARLIHPDASSSDPALATAAMALLNEAWAIVRTSYLIVGIDEPDTSAPTSPPEDEPSVPAPAPPSAPPPPPRLPESGECAHCGWAPAGPITLRSVGSFLIWWSSRRTTNPLCGVCATARHEDVRARTLVTGWWGLPGAVVAGLALRRNRRALKEHARRYGRPLTRASEVVTRSTRPAVIVPAWHRGAVLTAAAAVTLVVVVAAFVIPAAMRSSAPTGQVGLGACVTDDGAPVDCVDPRAAWTMVRVGRSAADCARDSLPRSFYDPRTGTTYCASSLRP
ncbi:MAG: DnaJ domain-containing protein [Actinobacteria bacterium]|nr:DnaJ domain-containing protein [Actinomycetota bacterium]